MLPVPASKRLLIYVTTWFSSVHLIVRPSTQILCEKAPPALNPIERVVPQVGGDWEQLYRAYSTGVFSKLHRFEILDNRIVQKQNNRNSFQSKLFNSRNMVQINFPENLLIFKFQNRISGTRGIWKIDIKQCKTTRWFELEFASGTRESAVRFSLTLAAEFWKSYTNVRIIWH
jgi:hypothetical protein